MDDLPFMKPPQLRPRQPQETGSKRALPADETATRKPVESPKRRALEQLAAANSPRAAPVETEQVQPDKIRRRARFLSEQSSAAAELELLDSASVPSLAAPTNPEADAYAKMAAQYLEVGGEANERPARDAVEAGLAACPGHAECSKLLEVAVYSKSPSLLARSPISSQSI